MRIPKIASLAALAMGAAAAQAGYIVDVGYADDLRASPFFPIPWIGDAGVVTYNQGAFADDNGAVGIDNRGGSSSVTIDMTTFSYTINYSGAFGVGSGLFTVAAGQFGIIVLGDTSDISYISGATYGDLASGCNGDGSDPAHANTCSKVTFDDGSGSQTFNDSGHVLDTGGFDFATNGSNESFQWRQIDTIGGQAGVPEPTSIALVGLALAGLGFGARKRT